MEINKETKKTKYLKLLALLFTVWIMLFCVLFCFTERYNTVNPDAERSIKAKQLEKDIYIDGELIYNWQLERPFVCVGEKAYAPVTEDGKVELSFIGDSECHFEEKEFSYGAHFNVNGITEDLDDVLTGIDGKKYYSLKLIQKAGLYDCFFDELTGYYLSSDPEIAAKEYSDANPNRSYIEGRSSYISYRNQDVSSPVAIYYEYLFRHAALCEKSAPEDLLMAVSFVESKYTSDIGKNAAGLMQVLVKYALKKGYTMEQIYDPHINIHYGALYISDRMDYFAGDEQLALTAYNKGLSAVLISGVGESVYADRVLTEQQYMRSWLLKKGFGSDFVNKIELEK